MTTADGHNTCPSDSRPAPLGGSGISASSAPSEYNNQCLGAAQQKPNDPLICDFCRDFP